MVVNQTVATFEAKLIELWIELIETRRRASAKGVRTMVNVVREVGDVDDVERARQKTYSISDEL